MTWLAALRDHPERPPVTQRMVLVSLAQRTDWSTGRGFASAAQLAADADCGERTVRNATTWARKAAMLMQTKRGHRLGDGRVTASQWRLCLPSQPESHMPVEDNLNRQIEPSQPARPAPPSRTNPSAGKNSAGDSIAGKEKPAGHDQDQEQPNANSGNRRVHVGPDFDGPDDQQTPLPVTHQSPATDRNARASEPGALANGSHEDVSQPGENQGADAPCPNPQAGSDATTATLSRRLYDPRARAAQQAAEARAARAAAERAQAGTVTP